MNSLTPNQARDGLIESNPESVSVFRKLAILCEEQRNLNPDTYLKCPRCYGLHSVHGNYDNLCDMCCQTLLEYFPEHPSTPLIKEAHSLWQTKR